MFNVEEFEKIAMENLSYAWAGAMRSEQRGVFFANEELLCCLEQWTWNSFVGFNFTGMNCARVARRMLHDIVYFGLLNNGSDAGLSDAHKALLTAYWAGRGKVWS